jgi:hypothetical protein
MMSVPDVFVIRRKKPNPDLRIEKNAMSRNRNRHVIRGSGSGVVETMVMPPVVTISVIQSDNPRLSVSRGLGAAAVFRRIDRERSQQAQEH